MPTAREEIIAALRANQWKVGLRAGAVTGQWRRRSIACTFGSDGRITGAHVRYPLTHNSGTYQGRLEAPMRLTALAFIRGEK
jgi:hypothetical protein